MILAGRVVLSSHRFISLTAMNDSMPVMRRITPDSAETRRSTFSTCACDPGVLAFGRIPATAVNYFV